LAAESADLLVVASEWPELAELDLERLHSSMKNPVIVDTRNLFDPATARAAGFEYSSVGRR